MSERRTYEVTITGITPLLMHWDNIDWADALTSWKDDPANKQDSKAGDDRTPAWRWVGCVYHDGEHVTIPSDNLASCLMAGGAMVPIPKGKNGKTFKAQSQSGMMVGEFAWPLRVGGSLLPCAPIDALKEERDFAVHRETVRKLGFSLFVKRATVGQSKHIRVRPRFDNWSASGTVQVWDKDITTDALQQIFGYAGQYKGLGDWRPGSPKKPGPHGMFTTELKQID